jgi:hypothetical protein
MSANYNKIGYLTKVLKETSHSDHIGDKYKIKIRLDYLTTKLNSYKQKIDEFLVEKLELEKKLEEIIKSENETACNSKQQKIVCECGSIVLKYKLNKHKESKKHSLYLDTLPKEPLTEQTKVLINENDYYKYSLDDFMRFILINLITVINCSIDDIRFEIKDIVCKPEHLEICKSNFIRLNTNEISYNFNEHSISSFKNLDLINIDSFLRSLVNDNYIQFYEEPISVNKSPRYLYITKKSFSHCSRIFYNGKTGKAIEFIYLKKNVVDTFIK